MAKLNKADAMALISSFHRHGQCAQAVSVRRAFRRGCAGSATQSLSSQCASGCTATVRRAFRRGWHLAWSEEGARAARDDGPPDGPRGLRPRGTAHVVAWCDAGAGEVARMPGQRVGASVRPRTHSHAGCAWRETFPLLWNPARSASVLHACQVVRSESPCTCKHCTRLRCILLRSFFRRACTSCCCCVLHLLHAFLHAPSACFHISILSPATRAQSLSPGKPRFPCCAEPFAVQAGPARPLAVCAFVEVSVTSLPCCWRPDPCTRCDAWRSDVCLG